MPVPYEEANSPQAWAAAVPLLAVQLFLGLVPDAPRGRCYIAPWLSESLPELTVQGITIEQGRLELTVVRRGGETVIDQLGSEKLEVIQGNVIAPLWGLTPPAQPAEGKADGSQGPVH